MCRLTAYRGKADEFLQLLDVPRPVARSERQRFIHRIRVTCLARGGNKRFGFHSSQPATEDSMTISPSRGLVRLTSRR
jgi:hypothetical protein